MLHPSHSHGFYRGVYWCWRCQEAASAKPRKLAQACRIPMGTTNIDLSGGKAGQLMKQKLPSNMRRYGWPLQPDEPPHPSVQLSQPHGTSRSSGSNEAQRHRTRSPAVRRNSNAHRSIPTFVVAGGRPPDDHPRRAHSLLRRPAQTLVAPEGRTRSLQPLQSDTGRLVYRVVGEFDVPPVGDPMLHVHVHASGA